MERKVICVLGMHRSGTSCLAGTLEEAGVSFGNVSKKNPYNLKGNYENLRIMELHENLLVSNNGSWDSPPEFVIWSERHQVERNVIIEEYKAYGTWGFKDPRTLFTIEGWMEALPDIYFVGTFRDPVLVAKSLQYRDKLPVEKGLEIWAMYNKKLLNYYEEFRFPVLSFDLPPDAYENKIAGIISGLGLPVPENRLNFFSPELRHSESGERIRLPSKVFEIQEKLNEIAI